MQRNIITTIKFSSGQINMTVLEKLPTNMVEIFNVSTEASKASSFIEKSLKEIEGIIGGALTEVGVVIEPVAQTNAKIFLHRETINIAGDFVTLKDIENVMTMTKNSHDTNSERVILAQPIKFDVLDVMTKSYSQAPINKKGNKLTVTSTLTTISSKTYDYIKQVVQSHGIKISQILLAPQVISQNNLSPAALKNGAILINVGQNQSFITINKNLSTIASMSIYDFGYKNLINGVAKIFGCTKKEALDLLSVYSTLDDEKINRVIYSRQDGIEEKVHYLIELKEIIKSFTSKLLLVAKKYIEQKQLTGLPVVVSGKLNEVDGLEQYVKVQLSSTFVSLHNPLSFVELNKGNIEGLGQLKFIERMDEALGRQFNTIVETNPNLISSLKKEKKNKTWFAKFTDLLGGKHE